MEGTSDASDFTPLTSHPLSQTTTRSEGSDPDYDVEEFRQRQSLEIMARLAPTIAFIVLLSVVGLVGNTVVFRVYYTRFEPSVTRTYILAMSVCDLLSNALFLPTDLLEIRLTYVFYAAWACKLSRSVRSLLTFFSAVLLVAVALDRQRTVCSRSLRPSRQSAMKRVHVSLALCVVISVALTLPYTVLTGRKTLQLQGTNVTRVICSVQDRYVTSLLALVYQVIVGLAFVISFVIMAVSYGRIARWLWLQRKAKRSRRDPVEGRAESVQLKSMKRMPRTSKLSPRSRKADKTAASHNNGFTGSGLSDEASSSDTSVRPLPTSGSEGSEPTAPVSCSLPSGEANQWPDSKYNASPSFKAMHSSGSPRRAEESGSNSGRKAVSSATGLPPHSSTESSIADGLSSSDKVTSSSGQATDLFSHSSIKPGRVEEDPGFNKEVSSSASCTKPSRGEEEGSTYTNTKTAPTAPSTKPGTAEEESTKYNNTGSISPSAPFTKEGSILNNTGLKPSPAPTCQGKKIPVSTTLMLFVLTALFVLNCLPYLVMAILDAVDRTPNHLDLNVSSICRRSFLLNSVVNPFVYSFCNRKFRRECRAFLCRQR